MMFACYEEMLFNATSMVGSTVCAYQRKVPTTFFKVLVSGGGGGGVRVLGGPFEVPWRHNLVGSVNEGSSVLRLDGGAGNCALNILHILSWIY